MARPINVLSAKTVQSAEPGRHGDGGGLYLLVRDNGSAFWLFRYKIAGKMREMGLGAARGTAAVKLADARDKAADLLRAVRAGLDPLEERAREATQKAVEAEAAQRRSKTFREAAEALIASKSSQWTNEKHRKQWSSTLQTYAYPILGERLVGEIETDHIMEVIEPIWAKVPETAIRVRARIEEVLNYARAMRWRVGDNPATWKANLKHLLPKHADDDQGHHPSLPWAQITGFMKELRSRSATTARALEWTILTAARTKETLEAQWKEIDLGKNVWIRPSMHMKTRQEHRVPLVPQTIAILTEMAKLRPADDVHGNSPIFPNDQGQPKNRGRPMSQMAIAMLLRRMNPEPTEEGKLPQWYDPQQGNRSITVHGFRATFRTWAQDNSEHDHATMEAAMAHVVGTRTEAAYNRTDVVEKRRTLMTDWANFCDRPEHVGNVTPIRRGAKS